MADSDQTKCNDCGYYAASFLLRIWVGLRLFFAGLEKFKMGAGVDASYSISNYSKKMGMIAETTAEHSFLPGWACKAYALPLGPLLIFVGLACLIGVCTRLSLLAAGLLFVSLAFGLMVLPDDAGALNLGIHVAITAFALCLSRYDWLSLDWLKNRKKGV